MQLKSLHFIVVPLSMNCLKTFKLSTHTFGKTSCQKWAVRRPLQLNLTQKSHENSMINAWTEAGGSGWSIQLKIQYLKCRNEWNYSKMFSQFILEIRFLCFLVLKTLSLTTLKIHILDFKRNMAKKLPKTNLPVPDLSLSLSIFLPISCDLFV